MERSPSQSRLEPTTRVESLADRFELGEVLTCSAGGTYIQAVERANSRPVLLKVGLADAGVNEALAREAALFVRLDHFHISKLLDLIRLPGDGLAIKLVAIQSTLAALAPHSVAASRIELWRTQLEQAVRYLHRSGVSLKGLRPEHIGIRPSGDGVLFNLEGACDERFALGKEIERQAGAVIQLGRTPARLRESERRALAQLQSILSGLRRTRVRSDAQEPRTFRAQEPGAVVHLFGMPYVAPETCDEEGTKFMEPLQTPCAPSKPRSLGLKRLARELRSSGLYLPLEVGMMSTEQIEALEEIERGLAEDPHGIYRLRAWLEAARLCRDRFGDVQNAALFFELALDCNLKPQNEFFELQDMLETAALWELVVASGERHLERLVHAPLGLGSWPIVVTQSEREDLYARITVRLADVCREHLGDKARACRIMRKGSTRYPKNTLLVSMAITWNLEEGTLVTTQKWLTRRLRHFAEDGAHAQCTDVRELLRRFGLRCAAEEQGEEAVKELRAQVLEHAETARLAQDYWRALELLECALCLGGDPQERARLHTRCAFLAEDQMEQPVLAQLHRARATELVEV